MRRPPLHIFDMHMGLAPSIVIRPHVGHRKPTLCTSTLHRLHRCSHLAEMWPHDSTRGRAETLRPFSESTTMHLESPKEGCFFEFRNRLRSPKHDVAAGIGGGCEGLGGSGLSVSDIRMIV